MAQSTKGYNSWNIFLNLFKVNQVIFSSLPIYSSSYEALAPTVFEILCWQGKNAQIYKGSLLMPRSNRRFSSLPIYLSSYEALAPKVFEIFCWQDKKNAQIYKGPLLMKYFSEFIQKLTRSSTSHYQSIHQVSRLLLQQFLKYFAHKVKNAQNYKGPWLMKYF